MKKYVCQCDTVRGYDYWSTRQSKNNAPIPTVLQLQAGVAASQDSDRPDDTSNTPALCDPLHSGPCSRACSVSFLAN